jgi:electron transfer flavoprotein beta subunit
MSSVFRRYRRKMPYVFHIVVCMKQVYDPDSPPSAFRVNAGGTKVIPNGVPPVISPFDENALEAALRIKDTYGGTITVMSMGKTISKRILDQAVASGADDLVLLQDETFEDLDSYATACCLAAAIEKRGSYNLILCGGQAADSNSGLTGFGIAELLNIPCIPLVTNFELCEARLRAISAIPDGFEEVEVSLPALATVESEIFSLRYPTLPSLRAAQKKPATTMTARDVGIDVASVKQTSVVGLSVRLSTTTCKIIGGASAQEAGANLAITLIDANVI